MTDDTVYVVASTYRASSRCYHSDKDCRYIPADKYLKEHTREEAEMWGRRECRVCAGTAQTENPRSHDLSWKLLKADPDEVGI